jgi:hypothetical protein
MNDKDQYIADLEAANRSLQEQLEDYEDRFIRKLDSLGVGKNIDIQTFSNLITVEQFVEYLSGSNDWNRTNAFGNYCGDTEYTFEFKGGDDVTNHGKRIVFIVHKKNGDYAFDMQRSLKSFRNFWDLWISLTGGKKNIALLLDILEYKYNSERGNKHGKKGN